MAKRRKERGQPKVKTCNNTSLSRCGDRIRQVIVVFASLCDEITLLTSEAQNKFYAPLLLYGETDDPDAVKDGDDQVRIEWSLRQPTSRCVAVKLDTSNWSMFVRATIILHTASGGSAHQFDEPLLGPSPSCTVTY